MLNVKDLTVYYGQALALQGISLSVPDRGLTGVIGPNGAGKTTLLRAISGLVRPAGGRIELNGQSLLEYKAHQLAKLGIAHCPEGRKPLPEMSVRDNLLVGGYSLPSSRLEGQLNKVYELFPVLAERKNQLSYTLSGGEQQMMAIGRALMGNPRLLLIDEPSLGLSPVIVDLVEETIRTIKESGVSVLMVEGNIDLVRDIADRVFVFDHGESVFSGTVEEIANDPGLSRTYLGM